MGKEGKKEKMGIIRIKIDGKWIQKASSSKSHIKSLREIYKLWRKCLVYQN